jgi:GNAT superfamily N-acetyltransferase
VAVTLTADIDIRLLSDADVDGALRLSASSGWNQRAADWHMLLQIAPSGAFAAATPERIVGTAIGIDYGDYGWIAMMLVDPGFRGRGLGARLLEAAMGAVPSGLPIRLDATPLGRPLYERYGFELETALTRHVRPAGAPAAPAATARRIRPMTDADLGAVMRMDDRMSGGHRHGALRWAFGDAPHYAWIEATRADRPQYCLGRGGRLFDHVGPIVADAPETAIALSSSAVAACADHALVVDAYDAHGAFAAWLHEARFEPQRPLYRMRRGAPRAPLHRAPPLIEFAIMGPEFS